MRHCRLRLAAAACPAPQPLGGCSSARSASVMPRRPTARDSSRSPASSTPKESRTHARWMRWCMAAADRVLVDSGPLIALADRGDAQHLEARRFFGKSAVLLLTQVGVLGEAVTFLRDRFGHASARRLGDLVRNGRALTLLPIE